MASTEAELPGLGATSTTLRPDGPDAYILSILDRELKLTLAGVELGSQRDRSMRALTRTVATLYEGRILRELIQNAYDGAGDEEGAQILLRLDRSSSDEAGTVDVTNSGSGFGRENVDAIVNPALSSKRPGNSIGHKGSGSGA
jgi:sensor histidine kinase regulating citrate/malate metabolism